jgi:hypothetical protein
MRETLINDTDVNASSKLKMVCGFEGSGYNLARRGFFDTHNTHVGRAGSRMRDFTSTSSVVWSIGPHLPVDRLTDVLYLETSL